MPEANPRKPQDFDSYLEAQAHNLGEIRQLPEFTLVERVIILYERSFTLRNRDPNVRFLQLFIVCHGALLSAAATIGRARTRRRARTDAACGRGSRARVVHQDGSG